MRTIRPVRLAVVAVLLGLLLAVVAPLEAQVMVLETTAGLTPGSQPKGITTGPDGAQWFTESGLDRIGRITTAGVVTEYAGGISAGAAPRRITLGPDNNLWFTEYGLDRIGRIAATGEVTEFSAGISAGAKPDGIGTGQDGALWFCESGTDKIGRITTAGVVTEYSAGITPGAGPSGITKGPDGAMWFTEYGGSRIGRITTAGVVTEFSTGISPGAQIGVIKPGPDGALWFTESGTDKIGRITTAGAVTEYSAGITAGAGPWALERGSDGALWFTEYGGDRVGRITTAGAVTEYSTGITPGAGPRGLNLGPDGAFWMTENAGRIARVTGPWFASTADVSVTVSGPASAPAGSVVQYTVTVTNNGPSPAQSVLVDMEFPAGVTFGGGADNGATKISGGSLPPVGTSGGALAYYATLPVGPSASGVLVLTGIVGRNVAPGPVSVSVAASADNADTPTSNNLASWTTNVTAAVASSADVAVTMTAPAVVPSGTRITYAVTVRNNGPNDAQAVTLAGTLPATLHYSGGAVVAGTQPSGGSTPSGGTAGGSIGVFYATLPVGATSSFSFDTDVSPGTPQGTAISFTMSGATTSTDPNPANNAATIVTTWGTAPPVTPTIQPTAGFGTCSGSGCATAFTATVGVPITVSPFRGTVRVTSGQVSWQLLSGPDVVGTGSGPNFTFTRAIAGTFTVKCTVDSVGCTSLQINAVARPPSLPLSGNRVRVDVNWLDPYSGRGGAAFNLPQDDHFGFFYYVDQNNPEVFVKVLDFGAGSALCFVGGLTDFAYTVTFTTVRTGQTLVFQKPAYQFVGYANNGDLKFSPAGGGGALAFVGTLETGEPATGAAAPVALPEAAGLDPAPAPQYLDFSSGRVRVKIDWQNPYSGETGVAYGIPKGDAFAFFYYTDPANPEVFVKVLDFGGGGALAFVGGLTDFYYKVTFTVLRTSQSMVFEKPAYQFVGFADNGTLRF